MYLLSNLRLPAVAAILLLVLSVGTSAAVFISELDRQVSPADVLGALFGAVLPPNTTIAGVTIPPLPLQTETLRILNQFCDTELGQAACAAGFVCSESLCKADVRDACKSPEDCVGVLQCVNGKCDDPGNPVQLRGPLLKPWNGGTHRC